jgi:hypothetical protein
MHLLTRNTISQVRVSWPQQTIAALALKIFLDYPGAANQGSSNNGAIDGATHINDRGSDSNLSTFFSVKELIACLWRLLRPTLLARNEGFCSHRMSGPCQIWKNFLIQRKLYE